MKNNKRVFWIVLTVALLLMVPLVAMRFTNEVKWDLLDFMAAGILLLGTGLTLELAIRKIKTNKYRILVCVGIVAALFLVWIELAVGVFGTPLAGS